MNVNIDIDLSHATKRRFRRFFKVSGIAFGVVCGFLLWVLIFALLAASQLLIPLVLFITVSCSAAIGGMFTLMTWDD